MTIRINAMGFFLFIFSLSASLLISPGPALAEAGHASKAEKKAATARIEKIQFRSNARYTRVVILLDKQARFDHTLQRAHCPDAAAACIRLVLQNSRPNETVDDRFAIGDDILNQAVISQDPPDTVVFIDGKQFQAYKIFSLENPARIVIDVWGRRPATAYHQNDGPGSSRIIAGKMSSQVDLICVDAGFGGRDTGPHCRDKAIYAKEINLQIAEKVALKIKNELGLDVIMTRRKDVYVSLEERTAMANAADADLFLSLHTNGSEDSAASGIETYALHLASDAEAVRAAAMEKPSGAMDMADLNVILGDLMEHSKVRESETLARQVQQNLYRRLKQRYQNVSNRGVKQAPFYVLLGADMPAILTQVGFLTNPAECGLLARDDYQEEISNGIVAGIRAYLQSYE